MRTQLVSRSSPPAIKFRAVGSPGKRRKIDAGDSKEVGGGPCTKWPNEARFGAGALTVWLDVLAPDCELAPGSHVRVREQPRHGPAVDTILTICEPRLQLGGLDSSWVSLDRVAATDLPRRVRVLATGACADVRDAGYAARVQGALVHAPDASVGFRPSALGRGLEVVPADCLEPLIDQPELLDLVGMGLSYGSRPPSSPSPRMRASPRLRAPSPRVELKNHPRKQQQQEEEKEEEKESKRELPGCPAEWAPLLRWALPELAACRRALATPCAVRLWPLAGRAAPTGEAHSYYTRLLAHFRDSLGVAPQQLSITHVHLLCNAPVAARYHAQQQRHLGARPLTRPPGRPDDDDDEVWEERWLFYRFRADDTPAELASRGLVARNLVAPTGETVCGVELVTHASAARPAKVVQDRVKGVVVLLRALLPRRDTGAAAGASTTSTTATKDTPVARRFICTNLANLLPELFIEFVTSSAPTTTPLTL